MRWTPLKPLFLLTALQLVLVAGMTYLALRTSVAQQQTASLYAEYSRLHSDGGSQLSPATFINYASKSAAKADRSLSQCSLLALGIGLVSILQLWLVLDTFRQRRRETPS